MAPEILLEKDVDCSLEHKSIVNSNHPNVWLSVPAWLASASDAGVHNIIRDEEESL